MFTGIVYSVGTVRSIHESGIGRTLVVDLGGLDLNYVRTGDSLAVNGICLTVGELRDGLVVFEVSPETMARCLVGEWAEGERINIEPALTLQTPLGGHLVSGHVDGAGMVVAMREADPFTRMELDAPPALGRLLAVKGAVAVDGVSLTVNEVSDNDGSTRFTVMLVPHTLRHTTLGALRPGARVHLEADALARYVQRLIESGGTA